MTRLLAWLVLPPYAVALAINVFLAPDWTVRDARITHMRKALRNLARKP